MEDKESLNICPILGRYISSKYPCDFDGCRFKKNCPFVNSSGEQFV
ncbi:MAG: hypothetical protein QMD14_01960 [Candidatus Aenigmarchaeota archaeon]|nr:hypothetical protein [Candidatus Aenigmarchaeota archaeon]